MSNQIARSKIADNLLKQPEDSFIEIDLSKQNPPKWMTRAFRNNRYTVMINDHALTSKGPAIRAMVQNHSNTRILHHWSEMQRIKNEIFGPEATAVEYYPAESKLQDTHQIYWMWIFPPDVLPIPI